MNNSNKKVRYVTLGCRVNQYETQGMREILGRRGFESWSKAEEAPKAETDYVVINTCTVTHVADRENRYWIRRAKREHPQAKIIVTGCGVERDREKISALPEVDLVLSNDEKAEIADRLTESCGQPGFQDQSLSQPKRRGWRYTPLTISGSQGHTRAFVKIQDGCNHACSFCKVVRVRGQSRSRNLKEILEEVTRLRDAGYRDVVFAGIQLGAYGLDFSKAARIYVEDVLEACAQIEGIERIRLSSIEPTDVTPSLIEALRTIQKCSHHLHIPLQSGDDEVLERMNRRYSSAFYTDLIERLRSAMPDFALTLDVMAGFAGESEKQFSHTLEILEKVKPLKCHIFPYSAREGTPAAKLEDLPAAIKKDRVAELMRQAEELSRQFRSAFIGSVQPVLIETTRGQEKGPSWHQGLSANYMKVRFSNEDVQVGEIVPVELLDLQGEMFLGKAVSQKDFKAEGGVHAMAV